MSISIALRLRPVFSLLLLLLPAFAVAESLSAQLERLAGQQGFELTGQENLADLPAAAVVRGAPATRLGALLYGINHVLIEGPDGRIERLVILSGVKELPPLPPEQVVVNTTRRGTHHLVSAILTGENGKALRADLIVDTGASFVVLPDSMVPQLGIAPEALEERELQTAKGGVKAWVGVLTAVTLAGRRVDGVTVAFISDAYLGDNPLLGMSVLGRFQVTLDDVANRLILGPRALE